MSATDNEDDAVNYEIGSDAEGKFTIDKSTGWITSNVTIDREVLILTLETKVLIVNSNNAKHKWRYALKNRCRRLKTIIKPPHFCSRRNDGRTCNLFLINITNASL